MAEFTKQLGDPLPCACVLWQMTARSVKKQKKKLQLYIKQSRSIANVLCGVKGGVCVLVKLPEEYALGEGQETGSEV